VIRAAMEEEAEAAMEAVIRAAIEEATGIQSESGSESASLSENLGLQGPHRIHEGVEARESQRRRQLVECIF
jgi:hypothetical protein